jgi:cytochrome b pre-mRNA-processing protein 3
MTEYLRQFKSETGILYNSIILLCRNTLFYTKFDLIDTFQNRIHLIFIHISFIFIKIKQNNKNKIYEVFYQKMFDLIFTKIELNMREIGIGDMTINKNMRFLVKSFYDILLNCEKHRKMSKSAKDKFFDKYLKLNNIKNTTDNKDIIDYFNKYETFCFDLNSDSVLKGEIKFNYK